MKKGLFTALALLLIVFSFSSCQKTETIKVLQFNIWQEGSVVENGFNAVADEIVRSDADFVTLSEVRNYHNTRFCDRIVEALKERGPNLLFFLYRRLRFVKPLSDHRQQHCLSPER